MVNIKALFDQAIQSSNVRRRYRGLLGDGSGNVLVAGESNKVYVRVQKSDRMEVVKAWCYRVTPANNLPVWVAYNANNELIVDDFDLQQAEGYYSGSNIPLAAAGLHAPQHRLGQNDAVYIDKLQVGGAQALPSSGLTIRLDNYLAATTFGAQYIAGTTLDLTPHLPTGLNEQRAVLIAIDMRSQTYTALAGAAGIYTGYTPYQNPLTLEDVAGLFDTNHLPLAAFRLRTGQNQISLYDYIGDVRQWGGVKSYHDLSLMQLQAATDGTQVYITPKADGSITAINTYGYTYTFNLSAATIDLSAVPADALYYLGINSNSQGTYWDATNTLHNIAGQYYYIAGSLDYRVLGACYVNADGTIYDNSVQSHLQVFGASRSGGGTITPYTRAGADSGTTRYVPDGTLSILIADSPATIDIEVSASVNQSPADASFAFTVIGLSNAITLSNKPSTALDGIARTRAVETLQPASTPLAVYLADVTQATANNLNVETGGYWWRT